MLPVDAKARKGIPIYSGFVCYFPHAIAACAELSRIGNDQHNPGQPLHWAKDKSSDELDALMRHTVDFAIDPNHHDPDGVHPAVKRMWRACADVERLHDAGVDIFAQAIEPLTVQLDRAWLKTCQGKKADIVIIDEANDVDWPCILDRADTPHTPSPEEIIDMERPKPPKAIDVVYVDDCGEELCRENRIGPFASFNDAITFMQNNPKHLPGYPYLVPHTTED